MSTRPTPRKSGLAGASPFEPPAPMPPAPAAEVVDQAAAEPTPAAAQPKAARPARATTAKPAGTKKTYPPKVTFYQEAEDTARVRAAIMHTMLTEGSRTLSAFVNEAVMEKVERLEARYNDGKPWPPVGSGEMPQGRPMGE